MANLETYTPTTWAPEHWALAGPVVRAAARAGGWGSETVEYNVGISLTAFLDHVWPTARRTAPPDLAALLRPSNINIYTASMVTRGGKPRPAATRRSHLKRTMLSLRGAVRRPLPSRPAVSVCVDSLLAQSWRSTPEVSEAVRTGVLLAVGLGASRTERLEPARHSDTTLGLLVQLTTRRVLVTGPLATPLAEHLSARQGLPLHDEPAERAFAAFLAERDLSASQLEAVWLAQQLEQPATRGLIEALRPNHVVRLARTALVELGGADHLLARHTTRDLLRGLASRWHLVDRELLDVPAVTPVADGPGGRKGSARRAKALIAAARAQRQAVDLLSPEVEARMASYVPRKVDAVAYAAVKDMAFGIVRRCKQQGVPGVRLMLTDLVPYLAWARTQDVPMDLDRLCDEDLLETWAAQADLSDRSTRRSRIANMLKKANPSYVRASHPVYARRPSKPAYTWDEVQRLIITARNQTGRIRRGALVVLALGLGAGFDGRDLKNITTDHVVDHGEHGIQVISSGGVRRARMVWLRKEYEPLLREAVADLRPGQYLIRRSTSTNHNVTDEVVAGMSSCGDGPRLDPGRCRSTWLTALLAECVPLSVVLSAAGISTATVLVELAGAMAPPPVSQQQVAQRGTGSAAPVALLVATGTSP